MQSVNDYLAKVNSVVGQGYWDGTFGQIATESLWNQNKARLPSWYGQHPNAKTLWMGKRVMDCCGLDKFARWIQPDGSVPYHPESDLNQQMLFDKAKSDGMNWGAIGSLPNIPGIVLYKAGHMGIYRGNSEVVEARGGDYGVVVTKISDNRGWTNWFMNPYLDYLKGDIDMLKRGDINADVGTWQTILNSKGYGLDVDNDFGPATQSATNQHKEFIGLAKDGIVDFATLLQSYSWAVKDNATRMEFLQDKYDAEVKAGAELSETYRNQVNEINALKQSNANLTAGKNALKSRVDSLESENGMLEADNAELDKKIAADKFKIDTIDARIKQTDDQIQMLNQRIAELESVK